MKFIPNAVSRKVGSAALRLSNHSPSILFGAGVVGVAATAVLAARATLRLEEVLDKTNVRLETADAALAADLDEYTAQDHKKHKALIYIGAVTDITKLYGPTVLVGIATVGLLAGSQHILNKRNAALTAAYAAIDKGFKEYRARVREDLGEDKDRQYLYGTEKTKVAVVDPETGKKKIVEKEVSTTSVDPYSRIFNEDSPSFRVDYPEGNLVFLTAQQAYANQRLQSKGWLLLNDVYDMLGFERTKAGMVVGWVYGAVEGERDGYVDFGLFETKDENAFYEFVTNVDGEIILNFNVDGPIFNKLED